MDSGAPSDLIDGEAIDSATSTYHRNSRASSPGRSNPIESTRSNNDASPTPSGSTRSKNDASPTPLRNPSRTNQVSAQELSDTERAEQPPQRSSFDYREMILMPRLREIDLRPYRTIAWGNRNRNYAALGQTRGNIAGSECSLCSRKWGPFISCVVVPGMFKGGCCNCHYFGRREKCSFRHDVMTPGRRQPRCTRTGRYIAAQSPGPGISSSAPNIHAYPTQLESPTAECSTPRAECSTPRAECSSPSVKRGRNRTNDETSPSYHPPTEQQQSNELATSSYSGPMYEDYQQQRDSIPRDDPRGFESVGGRSDVYYPYGYPDNYDPPAASTQPNIDDGDGEQQQQYHHYAGEEMMGGRGHYYPDNYDPPAANTRPNISYGGGNNHEGAGEVQHQQQYYHHAGEEMMGGRGHHYLDNYDPPAANTQSNIWFDTGNNHEGAGEVQYQQQQHHSHHVGEETRRGWEGYYPNRYYPPAPDTQPNSWYGDGNDDEGAGEMWRW